MDRLGEAHREKFTREDRLLRRREFEAVYAKGARVPGRHFTLIILPNSTARSRLGLTVSRKVGNAVVRNRTRRRLREIFRRCRAIRSAGLDIVVQTRPAIAGVGLAQLDTEFKQGMERYTERKKGKRQ